MDLRDRLNRLSEESPPPAVLPLEEVQRRAASRRKVARVRGGIGLLVVGALTVAGIRQVDWLPRDQNRTTAPAAGAPDRVGSPSESPSPCALDACGSQRPLSQGKSWLAGVLEAVDMKYRDEYREDGGGFFLVPRWQMGIWVLPPEQDPRAWAVSHEYRPLWESHGVVVFGHVKAASQIGYLYWQAGGVDTLVEAGWNSEISQPDDLRGAVDRIIAEQLRREYSDEG